MRELPEEYLEYLKQNVNVLERIGDKFTGIDERVDYAVAQTAQLVKDIQALKEMGIVAERTEQISFSQTVQPLQGVRLEEYVPFSGRMTSVMFHFPSGCDALVEVAFGHGSEQICPSTGFLALDAATPVFPVSELVTKADVLWCEMRNGDGGNPHTITVTAVIIGWE